MRRLPLMVGVIVGVMLAVGCHDRRAGVRTLLGDGVEQWGQKLPYDHWEFNFLPEKSAGTGDNGVSGGRGYPGELFPATGSD